MKACILCGTELTERNHKEYRRKNYINKCDQCSTKEKKEYARAIPKKKINERSRKYREGLKTKDPVRYTCNQLSCSSGKRAKKLKMDHDIDSAYLVSISPKECPVFGFDLKYGGGVKGKAAASIDRIDSSKGYTRDNVQIISYLANLMKSNATEEEMKAFANWVLSKRSS